MKIIRKYGYTISLVLLALLSSVLVTACSSEDDTNGQPEVDILSRFNSEGKAWMSLQIPIGSQRATRATEFDGFDDGLADEWKVKDAYILIFAGTSEATATFASAYMVDNPALTTSNEEQITATMTISIDDVNINPGDKLYIFVLLNNNSSAITTSSFPATSVTFANGGTEKVINSSSTLSDLMAVTIGSVKDNSGYFLMTNAVLAKANTEGADLQTLTETPLSIFFPTEAEAEASPGAHINVERLAAKATVVNELSDENHKIMGNSHATFNGNDLRFALDNYNTSSYVVRHLAAVSYPRFVETAPIESSQTPRYRTYWAEDANYEGNDGLIYKNHANKDQIAWSMMGNLHPQYCAENTFDVANMKDNCTTSVLVRLQLNNGGDFYTTSVTGSDIVFQTPDNELTEQGTSASSSFSRTRSVKVTYDGTNYATIDEYLRQWLMETNKAFRDWVNEYAAGEAKHVAITLTNDAATGTATVSNVTQTARTSGDGVTAFASLNLVSYFANNIALKFYENGYCYYRVLIRHFDDEQTPWSSTASMTDNTTATVYGGDAESYLGRYGVVRNNWYNISINSVTHIGSPIIPPLTTNADDKVEQLLNATLRISGWEKHEQNL